jgi:hypothetical protein
MFEDLVVDNISSVESREKTDKEFLIGNLKRIYKDMIEKPIDKDCISYCYVDFNKNCNESRLIVELDGRIKRMIGYVIIPIETLIEYLEEE